MYGSYYGSIGLAATQQGNPFYIKFEQTTGSPFNVGKMTYYWLLCAFFFGVSSFLTTDPAGKRLFSSVNETTFISVLCNP
jgi:hypothetical protein